VDNVTVGGGGGTFVTVDGKPLIVASGGDGTGGSAALFSPYGNGNGKNGAGYLSNGSITNSTFRFLKPVAYVDGGYGNMYWYGSKGDGGFGGGQSPVTVGGVSGGGGYTGSSGDGVSGATCYGAGTITDLGATSNSAGYVTVSLMDPVPIKETWNWDAESLWKPINSILPYKYTLTRSDGIGLFVAATNYDSASYPQVTTSTDAKIWTNSSQDFTEMATCKVPLASSDTCIVYGNKSSTDGFSWQYNNLPINVALPPGNYLSSYNHNAIYLNGQFILQLYSDSSSYVRTLLTSNDGFAWNIITSSGLDDYVDVKAYNNGIYVGIRHAFTYVQNFYTPYLAYSTDLINWDSPGAFEVSDVAFGNGVFVASQGAYTVPNHVYISNDGITWTYVTIPNEVMDFQNSGGSICFLNGVFIVFSIAFEDSTTIFVRYYSSDGQNWTVAKQRSPTNITLLGVSQTLGFVLAFSAGNVANPYLTLDGEYIVPASSYFDRSLMDMAYTPESKTIVVVDIENNLYTNTDNGNGPWDVTPTVQWYEQSYLCYSKELGTLFFYNCRQTFSPDARIVQTYSRSGSEWIDHGVTYSQEGNYYDRLFLKPFWCKELGYFTTGSVISRDGINWTKMSSSVVEISVLSYHDVFVGLSLTYGSPNFLYYSSDGYNWLLASYPHENCQFYGVAWSPQLSIFACTGTRDGNYFSGISLDGIHWTETTSTIGGTYIVWSPELAKFYVSHDNYISETNDGQNWTLPIQTSIIFYPSGYYLSGFRWYSDLNSFATFHNNQLLFSKEATNTF